MNKRRSLFVLLFAVAFAWGSLAAVLGVGWDPKLGLDLQGGFSVRLSAPEGTEADVLDKAVEIMRRRIEDLGSVQEPEIAVSGDRSVVVQLPGVAERDRALNAIGSTGQLSFRPVFTRGPLPGISPVFSEFGVDIPGFPTDAEQTTTTVTTTASGEDGGATTTTTGPGEEGTGPAGEEEEPPATTTTTLPPEELLPDNVDPQTGITLDDDPAADAWLIDDTTGFVYHVGPALLLGSDLTGARAEFSGASLGAGWVVDPDFTSDGARKFEEATAFLAQFAPNDFRRSFAIVLDGTVVSAPQVAPEVGAEGLDAGSAIITIGGGEDQQAQAEDLATVLRYGALPVTFEQDRVVSISASLGSDSLRAGLLAGIGGLTLVALAMIAYYRALGLITVIGLSVFGSLVIGWFSLLGEFRGLTLTLAGVTGIIVSIGITSDSYIVYFERIKEEVRHGRPLRAAVDKAFPRAFRTILTADAVSLAGAALLWILAVGPVRGFAIALGLATITDVFVAYFYTRPAAAFLVRTKLGEGGPASIRGAVGHPAEARP